MEPTIQHLTAMSDKGPANGGSQPKRYVECEGGDVYLAKGTAYPEGSREYFNELLAARLANLLGIPVPRHAIIYIAPGLVEGFEGTYFGSLRAYDYEPLPDGSALSESGYFEPSIYSVLAFDELLKNPDRKSGDLLFKIARDQASPTTFLAIDHANAFTGSHWTAEHLARNHAGNAGYTAAWLFRGRREIQAALREVKRICEQAARFEPVVRAVASQCDVSNEEVVEVVTFLTVRAAELPDLVSGAVATANKLGTG
jgi:hypothetical protein